jgi:hypothetical protein
MRMRSFPFGARHVVPFLFYAAMLILAVLSIFSVPHALAGLLLLAVPYLAVCLAAALYALPAQFWRVAVAFWVMHSCYAAGTATGFFARKDSPAVGRATAPGANLGS